MRDQLNNLIERAKNLNMSASEKEEQRQSFAYGNAHIENERVTREMVAEAAKKPKKD